MSGYDDLIGTPRRIRDLTPIEESFCQYFAIEGLNGIESYRRASNAREGISVAKEAKLIRRRPAVVARIAELRRRQATQLILSRAEVLNGLARIASFDPRNLYDEDGEMIPLHELDDVTVASITGIKAQRLNTPTEDDPTKTTLLTVEVKLADKKAALDSLAKAMGMFDTKVEVTGKDGKDLIPQEISQIDLARRVAFLLTSGIKQQDGEK